jgi:DNA polymerase (family 10)
MTPLDATQVAKLLAEYGRRTALAGGNPYRSKAYLRAADSLAALPEPLDRIVAEDRLREIRGIGPAIADIVTKLHRTGTHPSLERMRREIPEGVLEMLSIPGLRPDQVLKLHQHLGLTSLAELKKAARQDRIKNAKGLGAALQRKIVQGLEIRKYAADARHVHRAAELIASAEKHLRRAVPDIERIVPAGDLRRGNELVFDLSVVAEDAKLQNGPERINTSQLSVYLTDREHFGVSLLLATGSQAHLRQLRALAQRQGLSLDERGLRRGDDIVAARSEAEVYRALGLQYIEPELREGCGEIALARQGLIPGLVQLADIRGILHAHTDQSDGGNSLEAMAQATRQRGYEYFGVADHSQSARYARGLNVEQIEQQHAEIDQLNRRFDGSFRIFKGIESDILPDGSLDYPDDVLRQFDFVVASIHGQFRMNRKQQTQRLLRAVANPFVTILGHMTGRQLLRRPGYDVDVDKVLKACADHGVAVEINANPWRLDLDWRWHRHGLELGCIFSINPDAHSIAELDLMRWGLAMARKGGLGADRVLNALDLRGFSQWLDNRRMGSLRGAGRRNYGLAPARAPRPRTQKIAPILSSAAKHRMRSA